MLSRASLNQYSILPTQPDLGGSRLPTWPRDSFHCMIVLTLAFLPTVSIVLLSLAHSKCHLLPCQEIRFNVIVSMLYHASLLVTSLHQRRGRCQPFWDRRPLHTRVATCIMDG